jgi:hypothetical protein
MLKLPRITLVAMASKNVYATVRALMYSASKIEYGRILLISHKRPFYLPKCIDFIETSKTKSIDEWSYKIIYEMPLYINTEFSLLIHSDGFVVNPDNWQDNFLNYDYIGSPFPLPTDDFSYRDVNGNIVRVGNSVSLRSKKLLDLPKKLNLPWGPYHGFYNEDGFLCCKNRHILENNDCKIAPIDVAKYFAHESMIPEIEGIVPFAFHKYAGSNSKYPKLLFGKF